MGYKSMRMRFALCLLAGSLLGATGCGAGFDSSFEESAEAAGSGREAVDELRQAVASSNVAEPRDRYLTTPTGWYWYTHASEATINARIAEGYRPIDIEVVGTSPYRFAVTMVKNQGDYQRSGFWWYFGKTSEEITALLSEKKARILDLEVYWVDGNKRYAVVLVNNTGPDERAWWYYSQISGADLEAKLSENNGRLIDLDTYERDGVRYFSAVMVRNTGTEAKSWWWYTNLTLSELRTKLRDLGARVVDIERRSEGRYAVILERVDGRHWSYYVGLSYDDLTRQIGNWGARIADIESYSENGQTRYAVMMLNNSSPAETAAGDLLRPNLESGGSYGFYLRRRGGSEISRRNQSVSVYPASTIKALQHAYAIRQVELSPSVSLSSNVTVYDTASQSCADSHAGHTPTVRSLETVLQRMMENSDNQDTNAVQEFFGSGSAAVGRALMNSFAQSTIGMTSGTQLVHKLGCGGASNNPSNLLTLADMALLYDRVAAGALFNAASRDDFYRLMLQTRFIDAVIDQEAPPGVDVAAFKADVEMAHKAGNVVDHKSIAGWISLPTSSGPREYVYGLYVEQDLDDENGTSDQVMQPAVAELMRDQIRSAMQAF